MATLQNQLKKSEKVSPNKINEELFKLVKSIERDIKKLNMNEQLFNEGVDANNKPLFSKKNKRGTYSLLTEQLSGGQKKAGDPYTLRDTGDFFKGFFIKIENDKALFGSTDEKTPLLIADFGDIFGLTDENLKALIDKKLKPLLIREIRRSLDL